MCLYNYFRKKDTSQLLADKKKELKDAQDQQYDNKTKIEGLLSFLPSYQSTGEYTAVDELRTLR